jgi:DhnA family fructose-bisphosphate aldolase class Ia
VELSDKQWHDLLEIRVNEPQRIADALATRKRRNRLTNRGMMFIVAADHTARGMVALGNDPRAMANRRSMINRLLTALENPRVDGVLASADIMDDLVVLGALEGKIAVGTMNRGGLAGSAWELDDRFTAYDTAHLRSANLDAGKLLLRIDDNDRDCNTTIYESSRAVQEMNDAGMMAMVEPIPYTRSADGKRMWDPDEDKLVRALGISAALGGSSARTWLKIQATADISAVAAMTSQPLLILGGAPGPDPVATFAMWERALNEPTVRGLVIGRALLYPADGDVAGAVETAADLVTAAAQRRGLAH